MSDYETVYPGVRVVSGEVGLDPDVALPEGTNLIGKIKGVVYQCTDEQTIDASLGAYLAGDVVGEDDCCTTLAIPWEFDFAEADAGGYVEIIGATLFNETENQPVQYQLKLFNATPTGELRDNYPNTNPVKADSSKWLHDINFRYSTAEGATVATTTESVCGDGLGSVPKTIKLAAGTTVAKGVLITKTAYTQTAGDKIRITLDYVPY